MAPCWGPLVRAMDTTTNRGFQRAWRPRHPDHSTGAPPGATPDESGDAKTFATFLARRRLIHAQINMKPSRFDIASTEPGSGAVFVCGSPYSRADCTQNRHRSLNTLASTHLKFRFGFRSISFKM
jgi:hypothetical protein